ncbi:MAG: low specificity L-threonine aldolase [Proteobacteria bacterium]|nr:low specificity L-threonine aldolase [Pseudomonadota bacterium]
MNFASDNAYGVLPHVWAVLQAADQGTALAYGNDAATKNLAARFAERFERDVAAFPVFTGTAANALALACLTPPFGAVLCHKDSHIMTSECGAPEFFSGAKLIGIDGADGKLTPQGIADALEGLDGSVHSVQPRAISISQATEMGTAYTTQEVTAIGALARSKGLKLHMDGARFANAVAHLGVTPAEATWKCGVDVMSFGATKAGALAAEAVVFFDPSLAGEFEYRRKRSGHLASKMRFVSVQLEAMLADDLWLVSGTRANALATHLAGELKQISGMEIAYPVETNMVFVRMPVEKAARMRAGGAQFHDWFPAQKDGTVVTRIALAFATPDEHVAKLIELAKA